MASPKNATVPPYIPFYWADYLADVNVHAMSTLAQGAYFRLLLNAWQSTPPCTIPDDDDELAAISGLSDLEWSAIKRTVLRPWTKHRGRWRQKRLWSEFSKSRALMCKNRDKACNAAEARWGKGKKPKDLGACSKHSTSNAKKCLENATETETEIESISEKPRISKPRATSADSDSGNSNFGQGSDSGLGVRETDSALLAIRRSLRIDTPPAFHSKKLSDDARRQAQANWTDWVQNIDPAIRAAIGQQPLDWFVRQAAEASRARKPSAAYRKRLTQAGVNVASLRADCTPRASA